MAASLLLLHHLVFNPPPPTSSFLFIKPLRKSATFFLQEPFHTISNHPHSSPLPHPSRFLCFSSSPTYLQNPSLSPIFLDEDNISDRHSSEDEIVQKDHQIEPQNNQQEQEPESPLKVSSNNNSATKLPSLSIKEKKELAAYAHSLGKKLKCQQVGKSGVTSSVAASFIENLEANELLKLKVHNSCPGELADVVKLLEEATGSVAVGQIGRAVILYRPSLTKLKAAERKKQAQRVVARKGFKLRPTEPMKEQEVRLSGRGRRGSSRF